MSHKQAIKEITQIIQTKCEGLDFDQDFDKAALGLLKLKCGPVPLWQTLITWVLLITNFACFTGLWLLGDLWPFGAVCIGGMLLNARDIHRNTKIDQNNHRVAIKILETCQEFDDVVIKKTIIWKCLMM